MGNSVRIRSFSYFKLGEIEKEDRIDFRKKIQSLSLSLNRLKETSDRFSSLYKERIDQINKCINSLKISESILYRKEISEYFQIIWDSLILANSLASAVDIRALGLNEDIPILLEIIFINAVDKYKENEKVILPEKSPKMQAFFEHTLLRVLQNYGSIEEGVNYLKKSTEDRRRKEYLFYADGGEYEGYSGYSKGYDLYTRQRKRLGEVIADSYPCRARIILSSLL